MNDNNGSQSSPNLSKTQNWQEFTFLCDTPDNKISPKAYLPEDGVFPLSESQVGDYVRIVEVQVLESAQLLTDVGFIPGAEILVKSCTDTGSVIVVLQDKSLGFGANMTRKILVTKIELF